MAIRWVSTPESIKANEPSVLAIAETLTAMGVSVWIAVTWDTYVHIAIGACIAPLLLMRTLDSFFTTLQFLSAMIGAITRSLRHTKDPIRIILPAFGRCVAIPLSLLLATFGGWAVSMLRNPIAGVLAIPMNWSHFVLSLDLRQPLFVLQPPLERDPEFTPQIEGMLNVVTFAGLKVPKNWSVRQVAKSSVLVMAFLIHFASAVTYRWSIKSTAIIWFPLLWAMRSTKDVDGPLRPCLTVYRRDPFTTIVLWFSVASLAGFFIKLVLLYEWAGFAQWLHDGPLRQFLSLYVAPAEIPRWQLAIAINSAIAIGMHILAGRWLVRLEHERLTDESWPRRVFQTGLFIRRILSCYTVACTLYITSIAAWNLEWPALGEQWFPWQ